MTTYSKHPNIPKALPTKKNNEYVFDALLSIPSEEHDPRLSFLRVPGHSFKSRGRWAPYALQQRKQLQEATFTAANKQ